MKVVGLYGALDWDANEFSNPDTYITYIHDAGATLFVNGKHVRSINEERLTRIKDEGNYPRKSIKYVLGEYAPEDIDIVCYVPSYPEIGQEQLVDHTAKRMLRESFPNAEVWMLSHHLCHAASSVFTAPFNSGSFLTLDGLGSGVWDFASGCVRFGENNSIGYFDKKKKIFRTFRGSSELGLNTFGEYYCNMSQFIYDQKHRELMRQETDLPEDVFKNIKFAQDFDITPKEGKVMGLSAYGKNLGEEPPVCFSTEFPKKMFDIDRWEMGLPEVHFYDYGIICNYLKGTPEDKAYYTQYWFEKAIYYYVSELRKDYLEEDHCFAGGCFLNITANTLLKPLFRNMHIPPYTNDSGIHFGAAAWGSYKMNQTIEMPTNIALLGKSYDDFVPEETNCEYYEDFGELCEVVAHELDQDKIVGWFQGRSEHGPRALGSRSLLMSPKKAENKNIMNDRVKKREYWRPFAGIMLEEYVDEYFDDGMITPYMLYSQTSITKKLPAIDHRDRTCRIQTVNDELNPRMCQLLRKLEIPVLMNTSFNISGEPIVETPEDAIASFKKMDIDYLVIGNYLLWN
jgi:carbamoyltransferase